MIMENKGLIIGIDYSDEYCKACYYSEKHAAAESVAPPGGTMRFLIPTVLCFASEKQDWIIGWEAKNYAVDTGAFVFNDLLLGTIANEKYTVNGEEFTYKHLLAIYIGKILEFVRIRYGIFPIECVNIAMRKVNSEIKEAMEQVFGEVGVEKEKLHLINYAESFAYFILREDRTLWADGTQLFDYSADGFFVKHLTASEEKDRFIIYVNERNYSMEFSIKDVENEFIRPRLDDRLNDLYEDIKIDGSRTSVYFTGEGFEELWFSDTLKNISATRRAFRGNNIYARGACLKGVADERRESKDAVIICRERTKASIGVEARYKGAAQRIEISPAATDWYEAYGRADFILDETRVIDFRIVSMLSREETGVRFDLTAFPIRPPKTTRVRVSVKYINENECEICVRDIGFGEFFKGSGREVRKILNLEGYI